MSKKIIFSILSTLFISSIHADDIPVVKQQAMLKIESSFALQTTRFTDVSTPSQVTWPSGLDVTIDNSGRFNFKSKTAISISKITVTINNTTADNKVDLKLQPNTIAHYFFSSEPIKDTVSSIDKGYKFLGVYKQINANDFSGYTSYRYKIIQVGVSWTDEKKIYNQSNTDFMLLMAK